MSQPLPCDGTGRRILAAIEDDHVTDDQVAAWCGDVARSLVGHWRSGARSMPAWAVRRTLRRVSPAVAVVALRELAPAGVSVSVEAEDVSGGLGVDAARLSEATAVLARQIAEAQEDGVVDEAEARRLHAGLDAVAALQVRLRSGLRAVRVAR